MLVTLQEYRERFFAPDSRPHMNTIRNWVRGGKLPTEKRGKRIYIQTDKLDQVTGNRLLDRIMGRR